MNSARISLEKIKSALGEETHVELIEGVEKALEPSISPSKNEDGGRKGALNLSRWLIISPRKPPRKFPDILKASPLALTPELFTSLLRLARSRPAHWSNRAYLSAISNERNDFTATRERKNCCFICSFCEGAAEEVFFFIRSFYNLRFYASHFWN